MKNREERSQHFFDTSVPLMDDGDAAALYGQVCGETRIRPFLSSVPRSTAVEGGGAVVSCLLHSPCHRQSSHAVPPAQRSQGGPRGVSPNLRCTKPSLPLTPCQLLYCTPCCLGVGTFASCQGSQLPVAKCFIKIFPEFVFPKRCLKWPAAAFLTGRLLFGQGFTDDQLVLVEQSTLMVEEREREIRQIVQSISDLSEIFRDLGAMIVEQVCVRGVFPILPCGPSLLSFSWESLNLRCLQVLWAVVIPCENAGCLFNLEEKGIEMLVFSALPPRCSCAGLLWRPGGV